MAGSLKFDTWLNDDDTENYKCRAFVNFNGDDTVAIRASGNVSSITDNGTGDYTVNFTAAFADANYTVSSILGGQSNSGNSSNSVIMIGDYLTAPAVGSCRIIAASASNGTLKDHQRLCLSFFR